jgi:ketosteroid isomerase-like protein
MRRNPFFTYQPEDPVKTTLPFLLCLLLLSSCAPPAPDIAQLRKTLEEMTAKAEQNMMAGTIDTNLADYTDDAVSMPNNGPMLKGKPAIREYYQAMMSMGMKFTGVDFVSSDLQASGSYAYELGTYTMTIDMGGITINDKGKYLTVYERGTDGKWRVKVETWNTDTMPPMPGAGA